MTIIEQERFIQAELLGFKQLLAWDFDDCLPDVCTLLQGIFTHLFDERLNVNWLLEHCNTVGSGIHTQFKLSTKFTIRDFVEDRRIMAAMWLLWHDNLDITTIGFRLGYRNYRTFARAFQRYVGCAPRAYRRRMSHRNLERKCRERTLQNVQRKCLGSRADISLGNTLRI